MGIVTILFHILISVRKYLSGDRYSAILAKNACFQVRRTDNFLYFGNNLIYINSSQCSFINLTIEENTY